MARVDDSVAEVDENLAKGGRWRGRHQSVEAEGGHRMLPPLPNLLPPFAEDVAAFCQPGYH